MRRTTLLLTSLAMVLATLLVVTPGAQALSAPKGLTLAKGGRLPASLTVAWGWSRQARSYQLQVADGKSFAGARTIKVARQAKRPANGKQSYRITGLKDGTRYFVRVRAAAGTTSGWSGVLRTSTPAKWPADGSDVRAEAGPGAGEVTFTWRTTGENTDYFRLDTALTPFRQSKRNFRSFKIDADRRSYTLSAAQTADAGAGAGVGWSLVWRLYGVNGGSAALQERYFDGGNTRVRGRAPQGDGSQLRVASYNLRADDETDPMSFRQRAPLLARTIKNREPGIVLLQEAFYSDIYDFRDALDDRGMRDYQLTYDGKYSLPGHRLLQTRILYDTDLYEQVGSCEWLAAHDCAISVPSKDGQDDYVAFARLREIATGQELYVASFHLTNGDDLEAVRARAMGVVVDTLDQINTDGLPVIVGGDANSSQLRDGWIPHDELMDAGYYDTASTVRQLNEQYGTHNDFTRQKPSAFGISPRIDLIATKGMPGSALFENVLVPDSEPFPSDHNLIVTDLRLP